MNHKSKPQSPSRSRLRIGMVQINNTFNNSCYLPYTIGLLQAYSEACYKGKMELCFQKYLYTRLPVADAVQRLCQVDVAAFSVYVWNANLSLAIACRLKEVNPDVVTVFGGPHVPKRAEEYLREHPWVDVACHGEGEVTFCRLLEEFPARNWGSVPSVSFLNNGVYVTTPRSKRISDLSILPSPYLSGMFKGLLKVDGGPEWLGLLETNRGCPFSCSYCDWGSATRSRMYTFDIERVRAELDWIAENGIEFVFCCDANFGLLRRDLEIAEYVAKTKNIHGYPRAFSVQNSKNTTERSYAIQRGLAAAGLNKGVTLALQTVDETALANVGRKNISLASFEELQVRFNRDRVETYTDLILGLPGETYESFVRGTVRVIESGQHNRIQFINLSILPNAPMGDTEYQEKHALRIISSPVVNHHGSLEGQQEGLVETQQLVVGTSTMPVEDWIRARGFSWMCSLVYFDKLLQVPIMLLSRYAGCDLESLFRCFCNADDPYGFPVFSAINRLFADEAEKIVRGGPEYILSRSWLNVYWPHDEYVFIDLCLDEDKLDGFYSEAGKLLVEALAEQGIEAPPYLADALALNRMAIHRHSRRQQDVELRLDWPVWEAFGGALRGESIDFSPVESKYVIIKDEPRNTQAWLKEVVWFGNKKGAYLLPVERREDGGVQAGRELQHVLQG